MIQDLQFSQTGDTLRSLGGREVVVWNTHTGEILRRWSVYPPPGGANSIARFSPDGRYLFSSVNTTNPDSTYFYLWDVKTENLIAQKTFLLPNSNNKYFVTNISFSPDNKLMAVSTTSFLMLIKTDGFEVVKSYQYKIHNPELAQFSPDGKYLAVRGEFGPGNIREVILDTAKDTPEYDIQGSFGAFSPDGKYFVTRLAEVSLFETATGKFIRKLADKTPGIPDAYSGITAVCFTPGMKYIVTEEYRHRSIYYVDTTRLLRQYVGQTGGRRVLVSPDSNYIAEGSVWVSVSRTPWTITSVPEYQFSQEIAIRSIFPNPAENSVTIRFTIEESFRQFPVRITITDASGKSVSVLIAEEYFSVGEHSVTADVSGFASGAYQCTLTINGKTFTQSFVVVR